MRRLIERVRTEREVKDSSARRIRSETIPDEEIERMNSEFDDGESSMT